jgi:hypothetical protein
MLVTCFINGFFFMGHIGNPGWLGISQGFDGREPQAGHAFDYFFVDY